VPVRKVVVEGIGEETVKARVKEYVVVINIADKRLRHNCED